MAEERTRVIVDRVNPVLEPAELNFDREVLPFTPNGNATERHVCMAYEKKAEELFPGILERAKFWAEKLELDAEKVTDLMNDSPAFQGAIRAKLMKQGGEGYVRPKGPDFPSLKEVSQLILGAGAIPSYAFLHGLTDGEHDMAELLDLMASEGAAALAIIPERNWNIANTEEKEKKLDRLYSVVELARERGLPVFVGTEMNAYGQRFVDAFDEEALAPVADYFVEGGLILYAHTTLHAACSMGYLSPWAQAHFSSPQEKNAFYVEAGRLLEPDRQNDLPDLNCDTLPVDVLEILRTHSTA